MKSLIILGRQPALGLAELESLYGSAILKPIRPAAALLDMPATEVDFTRLGGSIKLTTLLDTLITTKWPEIEQYLARMIAEHLQYVPEGKFHLGISAYEINVKPFQINKTALKLKKIVKEAGRSVRVIPNKSTALSSAQVLHNKLFGGSGWEIVLYREGPRTHVCLTHAEQNIEAYAARDQNRPHRDARVGMLPPKLAQIILNLAVSQVQGKGQRAKSEAYTSILDPFCGTGVLLQEALLAGHPVYGTDIEPRMIEYTDKNLTWLSNRFGLKSPKIELQVCDATTFQWFNSALCSLPSALSVASEIYLGKPLSREPEPEYLKQITSDCGRILSGFLKNLGPQIKPGTRLCLAVPSWKTKNGFQHLKTLDKLKELGYTRIDFVHVRTTELVYFRPDQIVARELVVLQKI